jgi:hypothetical protein
MKEKMFEKIYKKLDKIKNKIDKNDIIINANLAEIDRLDNILYDEDGDDNNIDEIAKIKINKKIKILEAKRDNLFEIEHKLKDEYDIIVEPIRRNIAEKIIGNYYKIKYERNCCIKVVGLREYKKGYVTMNVVKYDFYYNNIQEDCYYYYYKIKKFNLLTKEEFNELAKEEIDSLQMKIDYLNNEINS